jgi:hypothetical protein
MNDADDSRDELSGLISHIIGHNIEFIGRINEIRTVPNSPLPVGASAFPCKIWPALTDSLVED